MQLGKMASCVFIKATSDAGFAAMTVELGELAGTLLDRACTKYTHWGLNALQMRLFLVQESGAAVPTTAAIEAALALEPLAVSAAVARGAWLVAVPTAAPGGPGSGGGPAGAAGAQAPSAPAAAEADPVALLTAFHSLPLSARQQETLRSHDALAGDRGLLATHTFAPRHVLLLLKRLENVVASSTRLRLVSATGIVLDGPVNGATAQSGTSILLALLDGQVLCAKVGPSAAVLREWQVSQAIHAPCAAPAVMKVLCYDTVPSEHGQGLLLMPLYPLSAAAALLVLTAEHCAAPQRLRCRDTLAALVAVCGAWRPLQPLRARGWRMGTLSQATSCSLAALPVAWRRACSLTLAQRCPRGRVSGSSRRTMAWSTSLQPPWAMT